jgi:hypothetical protein
MNLISCNRKTRPLSIRTVALVTTGIFIFTSVDIQLAHASVAPTIMPVSSNSILADSKEQLDDVQFMQDFDLEGDPLSQVNEQSINPEDKFQSSVTPQMPTQGFSPLANQKGKLLAEKNEKEDTTRFEDEETGAYFVADNKTSRFIEIGDFTNIKDAKDLQVRKFVYAENEDGELTNITIQTFGAGDELNRYQSFSVDESGALLDLLDSGIVVSDSKGKSVQVKTLVYDYDAWTVTKFNPIDAFESAVFEMDDNGDAYRVLKFTSFQDGGPVGYSVRYSDSESRAYLRKSGEDLEYVYSLLNGSKFGPLLAVNSLKAEAFGFNIALTNLLRGGQQLPVYAFKKIGDASQYIYRERLPNGAPGRILEINIVSEKNERFHQAFIYEKDSSSGIEVLSVIDYQSNGFVQFALGENTKVQSNGNIDAPGKLMRSGSLLDAITHEVKVEIVRDGEIFMIFLEDGSVLYYEAIEKDQFGRLLHMRGPPSQEGKIIEIRYAYDDVSETRTSFNLTELTYQKKSYQAESLDVVVEEGVFSISSNGEFVIGETSEKASIKEVSDYNYDIKSVQSFEYAFELLSQEGLSVAVPVESLTASDIEKILSLSKEVGIINLKGQIVLFTTDEETELGTLSIVQDLLKNADFVAHTHPNASSRPSDADINGAGSRIEYVIAKDGVTGYSRDEILTTNQSYQEFVDLLLKSKSSITQTAANQIQASEALNRFIRAMDDYEGLEDLKVDFRESGSEDENKAYGLAETDLANRLSASKDNFLRQSIVERQANIYELVLKYGQRYFTYASNISMSTTVLEKIEQYDADGKLVRLEDLSQNQIYVYEYDSISGLVNIINETKDTYQQLEYDFSVKAFGKTIQKGVVGSGGVLQAKEVFEYINPTTVRVIDEQKKVFNDYEFNGANDTIGKAVQSGEVAVDGSKVVKTVYDYGVPGQVKAINSDDTYELYNFDAAQNKFLGIIEKGRVIGGVDTAKTTYDYSDVGFVHAFNTDNTYQTYEFNGASSQFEKIVESGVLIGGAKVKNTEYIYSLDGVTARHINENTYEKYTYDSKSYGLEELREKGSIVGGNYVKETSYIYNGEGVVRAVGKDGTFQTYEYDEQKNEINRILQEGIVDGSEFVAKKSYRYDDAAGTAQVIDENDRTYVNYEYDATTKKFGKALGDGYVNAIDRLVEQREYDYSTLGSVIMRDVNDDSFVEHSFDGSTLEIGRALYAGHYDAANTKIIESDYDYSMSGVVRIIDRDTQAFIERSFDATSNAVGKILKTGKINGTTVVTEAVYSYVSDQVEIRRIDESYEVFEYQADRDRLERMLEAGKYVDGTKKVEKKFSYPDFLTRVEVDFINNTTSTYNFFGELVKFTDNDTGNTSYLENGLIQTIEDSTGNLIREFTYTKNIDGEVVASDFNDKALLKSVTQNVDSRLTRSIYENGVIENQAITTGGVQWINTDTLGPIQLVQEEDGNTALYFNTGTVMRFSADPTGGSNEVLSEVIDLRGRKQHSIRISSELDPIHPYQVYIDSDVDVDISVLEDSSQNIIGAIVYKKDVNGITVTKDDNPVTDFVLEADGSVRYYFYDIDNKLLRVEERQEHVEPGRDAPLVSVLYYKDNGEDVDYVFSYSSDGNKVIQRNDYIYDDEDAPNPDHIEQFNVAHLADPPVNGGTRISTIHYGVNHINKEIEIKQIDDADGSSDFYSYTADSFIEEVQKKNSAGGTESLTFYEQGPYFNDRINSSIEFEDAIPSFQTVYSYNDVNEITKIERFEIINVAADPRDIQITDKRLVGETLFQDGLVQVEFTYNWDGGTSFLSTYNIMHYEADGRTLNYSDRYDVENTSDFSPSIIQAKIDASATDSIETLKDAISALLLEPANDDHLAVRTYFNEYGNRAEYSVTFNQAEKASSLSHFNYDDPIDGDLFSIDQYNVFELSGFDPAPENASDISVPSGSEIVRWQSTVYFEESGSKTEFSVNYAYDVSSVQSISSYSVFNYASVDSDVVLSTDSYVVEGSGDVSRSIVQAKIDASESDSIETIRQALESILSDVASDDFHQTRTYLNKDQAPLLSVTLNEDKEIVSVSKFYLAADTNEIIMIDAFEAINAHVFVNQSFQDILDLEVVTSPANPLYDETRPSTRTYLENNNPRLSIELSDGAPQLIQSINVFKLDADGEIIWVDAFDVLNEVPFTDQDLGSILSLELNSGSSTPTTALYHETRPATRTYMTNGNPTMSITLNDSIPQEIVGVSRFNLKGNEVVSVDAFHILNSIPFSEQTLADIRALDSNASPVTALYNSMLIESRTYLEGGNPAMSITLSMPLNDGDPQFITAVSQFNLGEDFVIKSIDSYSVLNEIEFYGQNLVDIRKSDKQLSANPPLYDSAFVSTRTFIDVEGRPQFSLSMNKKLPQEIVSVSQFILNTDKKLIYIDSYDAIDDVVFTKAMEVADVIAYEQSNVTSGDVLFDETIIANRTFIDIDSGRALGSLSGKGDALSVFSYDVDENLIYIDQYEVEPVTPPYAGVIIAMPSTPTGDNFESRVFIDPLTGIAQGSLNAEGNSLSVFNYNAKRDLISIDQYEVEPATPPFSTSILVMPATPPFSDFVSRVFLYYDGMTPPSTSGNAKVGEAIGTMNGDGTSISFFNYVTLDEGLSTERRELASIDQYSTQEDVSLKSSWEDVEAAFVLSENEYEFSSRVFLYYEGMLPAPDATKTNAQVGEAIGTMNEDGSISFFTYVEDDPSTTNVNERKLSLLKSIDQYSTDVTVALASTWSGVEAAHNLGANEFEFSSRVFLYYKGMTPAPDATKTNAQEGEAIGTMNEDGSISFFTYVEDDPSTTNVNERKLSLLKSIDQYSTDVTVALASTWSGVEAAHNLGANEFEFSSRVFLYYKGMTPAPDATNTNAQEGEAIGTMNEDGSISFFTYVEDDPATTNVNERRLSLLKSIDQYSTDVTVALASTWSGVEAAHNLGANEFEFSSRVFLYYEGMTPAPDATKTNAQVGEAIGTMNDEGSISFFNYLEDDPSTVGVDERKLGYLKSIDQYSTDETVGLESTWLAVEGALSLAANKFEFSSRVFLYHKGMTPAPTQGNAQVGEAIGTMNDEGSISFFNYLEDDASTVGVDERKLGYLKSIDQYSTDETVGLESTWLAVEGALSLAANKFEFSSRVFLYHKGMTPAPTQGNAQVGEAIGTMNDEGSISFFNYLEDDPSTVGVDERKLGYLKSIDQYSTDETVGLESTWSAVEGALSLAANKFEFSSRVFLYHKGMTPAPTQGNAQVGEAIGTMNDEGSISFFNYLEDDPSTVGVDERKLGYLKSIDQYSTDETVGLESTWLAVEGALSLAANKFEFSSRVFLYHKGMTPAPTQGNAQVGEAIGTMNDEGSISFFNYLEDDPSTLGVDERKLGYLKSIDQYSTDETVGLESTWSDVEGALSLAANKFEFSSRVFLYHKGMTPAPTQGNAQVGEAIGTMNDEGSISFFNYLEDDPSTVGVDERKLGYLKSIDQYSTDETVGLESTWSDVEGALSLAANKFEFSSRVFLYHKGMTPAPTQGNAQVGEAIGTMNDEGSISFFNYLEDDPSTVGVDERKLGYLKSIDQYSTDETVGLESTWLAVEGALSLAANKFEFSSRVFLYHKGMTPAPTQGNAQVGEAIGTMNDEGSISFFNYLEDDPSTVGVDERKLGYLKSIDQYSTDETVGLESTWLAVEGALSLAANKFEFSSRVFLYHKGMTPAPTQGNAQVGEAIGTMNDEGSISFFNYLEDDPSTVGVDERKLGYLKSIDQYSTDETVGLESTWSAVEGALSLAANKFEFSSRVFLYHKGMTPAPTQGNAQVGEAIGTMNDEGSISFFNYLEDDPSTVGVDERKLGYLKSIDQYSTDETVGLESTWLAVEGALSLAANKFEFSSRVFLYHKGMTPAPTQGNAQVGEAIGTMNDEGSISFFNYLEDDPSTVGVDERKLGYLKSIDQYSTDETVGLESTWSDVEGALSLAANKFEFSSRVFLYHKGMTPAPTQGNAQVGEAIGTMNDEGSISFFNYLEDDPSTVGVDERKLGYLKSIDQYSTDETVGLESIWSAVEGALSLAANKFEFSSRVFLYHKGMTPAPTQGNAQVGEAIGTMNDEGSISFFNYLEDDPSTVGVDERKLGYLKSIDQYSTDETVGLESTWSDVEGALSLAANKFEFSSRVFLYHKGMTPAPTQGNAQVGEAIGTMNDEGSISFFNYLEDDPSTVGVDERKLGYLKSIDQYSTDETVGLESTWLAVEGALSLAANKFEFSSRVFLYHKGMTPAPTQGNAQVGEAIGTMNDEGSISFFNYLEDDPSTVGVDERKLGYLKSIDQYSTDETVGLESTWSDVEGALSLAANKFEFSSRVFLYHKGMTPAPTQGNAQVGEAIGTMNDEGSISFFNYLEDDPSTVGVDERKLGYLKSIDQYSTDETVGLESTWLAVEGALSLAANKFEFSSRVFLYHKGMTPAPTQGNAQVGEAIGTMNDEGSISFFNYLEDDPSTVGVDERKLGYLKSIDQYSTDETVGLESIWSAVEGALSLAANKFEFSSRVFLYHKGMTPAPTQGNAQVGEAIGTMNDEGSISFFNYLEDDPSTVGVDERKLGYLKSIDQYSTDETVGLESTWSDVEGALSLAANKFEFSSRVFLYHKGMTPAPTQGNAQVGEAIGTMNDEGSISFFNYLEDDPSTVGVDERKLGYLKSIDQYSTDETVGLESIWSAVEGALSLAANKFEFSSRVFLYHKGMTPAPTQGNAQVGEAIGTMNDEGSISFFNYLEDDPSTVGVDERKLGYLKSIDQYSTDETVGLESTWSDVEGALSLAANKFEFSSRVFLYHKGMTPAPTQGNAQVGEAIGTMNDEGSISFFNYLEDDPSTVGVDERKLGYLKSIDQYSTDETVGLESTWSDVEGALSLAANKFEFSSRVFLYHKGMTPAPTQGNAQVGEAIGTMNDEGSISFFNYLEDDPSTVGVDERKLGYLKSIDQYSTDETVGLESTWSDVEGALSLAANKFEFSSRVFLYHKGMTPAPTQGNAQVGEAIGTMNDEGSISFFNYLEDDPSTVGVDERKLGYLKSIDQYSTDETVGLESTWSDVEGALSLAANKFEFSSRVFLYHKGMTPAPTQGNAQVGEAIGTMNEDGSISFFNYVTVGTAPNTTRELASIDQYSTDKTVALATTWSGVETALNLAANEFEFSSRVFLYHKGMTPAPTKGNAQLGEAIGTMSAEGSISFFNYVVTDAGPPVRRELASIDQYSTDETVTLEASEIVWSDIEAKFTNPANEYEFSSRVFLYYKGMTPAPTEGNAELGEAIGTMSAEGSISFF